MAGIAGKSHQILTQFLSDREFLLSSVSVTNYKCNRGRRTLFSSIKHLELLALKADDSFINLHIRREKCECISVLPKCDDSFINLPKSLAKPKVSQPDIIVNNISNVQGGQPLWSA